MPASSKATARLHVAMERATRNGDLTSWLSSANTLYTVATESGESPDGLLQLRRTIRGRADELRAGRRSRLGRLHASERLEGHLGGMLADELRAGLIDDAEALDAIESLKARVLLDDLKTASAPLADPDAAAEAREAEVSAMRRQEPEDRDLGDFEMVVGSAQPLVVYDDVFGVEPAVELVERIYRDAGAGYDGLAAPAGLRALMGALGPGEALLEYAIPYRWNHPAIAAWVLVVTAGTSRLIELPLDSLPGRGVIGRIQVDRKPSIDMSPLNDLVFGVRTSIRQEDDERARAGLRSLYSVLIRPIVEAGFAPEDFDRWIVVPHGMLHHIPWVALHDETGTHLVERVAVITAPSASSWLELTGAALEPPAVALAMANPDLGPDYPQLLASEDEVEEVKRKLTGFSTTVLTGPAATEDELHERVPGAGLIHLATHGWFPLASTLDDHAILLCPGAKHGGLVRAEELRAVEATSVWLVVLSICNGGLYRLGPGDEPYGLIGAIVAAGSANVVGTLWSVRDRRTSRFMAALYDHLPDVGPADALRAVMVDHAGGAPLRDWAGFVALGDGRPRTWQRSSV